jgi:Holliday junction resolvasome RuvABC endonuclease subunit
MEWYSMETTEARHYIGIDPSLRSSGVAILTQNESSIQRRTLNIAPPKMIPEARQLEYIFRTVVSWLASVTQEGLVVGACIEGPSLGSIGRQDLLGEVRGVFKVALAQLPRMPRIDVIAPTKLKKFAAQHGGADKEDVKAGMVSLGWFARTLDEYDAAALAEICYHSHNLELPRTRAQAEVLAPKKWKPRKKWRTKSYNL